MRYVLLFVVITCCLEMARMAVTTKLRDAADLTWPFDHRAVYWAGTQPFVLSTTAEIRADGSWYSSNEFCAGGHGGTHFDAPYHFNRMGWKVGDIPLHRLIAKGITIDLSGDAWWLKGDAVLTVEHLNAWERLHDAIPDNCVILVNFGWSKYYYDETRYLGLDDQGNMHFPGISPAAAEWIVKSGKVVGVGVDTPSVDPGSSTDPAIHKMFAKNQIYLLENIKIPPVFPATGYVLYVMPMKIEEGTGAPLRLIAVPLETATIPRSVLAIKTPWYGHVIIVVSSITLFFLYANNW